MSYVIYNGKRVVSGNKYVKSVTPIIPLFAGWTNSTWDTFISSGQNIISAIEAQGTKGEANTEYLPFEVGDIIRITGNLTLNSGVYPTNTAEIHLINQSFGLVGTATFNPDIAINAGFEITSWPTMNFCLRFQNYNKTNGNACNCSCQLLIYKL
jgi:hypothetical protein